MATDPRDHRSRRALAAVVLVALALVTAGCGARWTDEQRAAVVASRTDEQGSVVGGGSRAGDARDAGSSTAADTGAAAGRGPAGGVPAGEGGAAAAGPVPGPAGPVGSAGGSSSAGDGGPEPCSAPSDAPGVTGDEIRIGSISSLSGPVPGLAASSAAAARAYVAYRNSVGGVCGRQIVLREADDGTDNSRYRSVMNELEDSVLGIAGGFALGDVGATDLIRSSGIPIVNSPSGQSVADLPSVIDIVPNPERSAKYRYIRDKGGSRVSLVYLAVDQSRFEANLQRRLMEDADIEVVQVQELPVSTLSYDSAARSAANSGANYLFFIGDANSNVKMARSVAGTGHEFAVFEIFTFAYGSSFADGAGSSAEGVVSWLRTLPNEDAAVNAEVARFNEWMQRVAPGEPRDPFAADSWAAAKAFFDNLEALPGAISRDGLVAQLTSVDTYDAGGFFGPIRLGQEIAEGCVVGVQVRDGTWTRLTPERGFLC